MSNALRWIAAALFIFSLGGCGKFAKPNPPEAYAPAEIGALVVSPSLQGIKFSWEAPTKDARSKELTGLEGYRVYRREVQLSGPSYDPFAKFELVTEIEDSHLEKLLRQKEEALAQGVNSKNIKVEENRNKFEYTDTTVTPGKRYLYQIVAINQGGVEGKITQRVQVLFRGELSDVTLIPYSVEDFAF